MFSLTRLTSKKAIITYFFMYLLLKIVGIGMPITSAEFLDDMIAGNFRGALLFGVISFFQFLFYQIWFYFLDIREGKMECQAWNWFCSCVTRKLERLDWSSEQITINEVQQMMGQEYEQTKNYVFKNQVTVAISLFSIVAIEVILFLYSKAICLFTLVAVPVSVLLSSKSNESLTNCAQENVEDVKRIRQYTEDTLLLSKEERTRSQKQLTCFENLQNRYADSFLQRVKRLSFANNILCYGSLNLVILITTLITGYQVYAGTLTVGGLYAVQLLVSNLWGPSEQLIEIKNDYANVKPMILSISNFLERKEAADGDREVNSVVLQDYVSLDKDGKEINLPLCVRLDEKGLYVVRGENGVGKTTLLESLLGYTRRYKGHIFVNGEEIQPGQVNRFIYIPAKPYISQFYGEGNNRLSSGQQKRLQIRLALASQGSAYLFDEPTNYLDAESRRELLDEILAKAKESIVVIVTHDDAALAHLQGAQCFELFRTPHT